MRHPNPSRLTLLLASIVMATLTGCNLGSPTGPSDADAGTTSSGAVTTTAGPMTGARVQLEMYGPNFSTPLITSTVATVSATAAEFPNLNRLAPLGTTATVPPVSIDISGASVVIDFRNTANVTFPAGAFHGFVIRDIDNALPDFSALTIDAGRSTGDTGQMQVTAAANQLSINLAGLTVSRSTVVHLNVAFAAPAPSMMGTWDGVVSNHPGSLNHGPIASFVLRLAAEPGGSQPIGQWSDNLGCSSAAVYGFVSSGVPTISVESLRCNDGDFWMQATSIVGNVASGRCRGGSCTFRMVRR